jgi:hypothetical protein
MMIQGSCFYSRVQLCEDLSMLMLSVVVCVHMCGWEGEKKGAMGTKNRAVDSEHRASKARGSQLCSKSHHSK